jgi:hypothetical protein
MLLGMCLDCLIGLRPRVNRVPPCRVGVMCRLLMIASFVVFGSLSMVSGGIRMMFGSLFVMFRSFLGHELSFFGSSQTVSGNNSHLAPAFHKALIGPLLWFRAG